MGTRKTPICCCSWMLNWVPGDFSSLLSIFCCKAVPGVGGTVCGVFKDKDSKCKGWGVEELKINFLQHPQGLLVIQKTPPRHPPTSPVHL